MAFKKKKPQPYDTLQCKKRYPTQLADVNYACDTQIYKCVFINICSAHSLRWYVAVSHLKQIMIQFCCIGSPLHLFQHFTHTLTGDTQHCIYNVYYNHNDTWNLNIINSFWNKRIQCFYVRSGYRWYVTEACEVGFLPLAHQLEVKRLLAEVTLGWGVLPQLQTRLLPRLHQPVCGESEQLRIRPSLPLIMDIRYV